MVRTFPAQWRGTCGDGDECDGEFEAGDMVGYSGDDELCCRACLMASRSEVEQGVKDWKDFLNG